MSHTKALLEESVSRVLEYLEKKHLEEISSSSLENIFTQSTLKGRIKGTIEKAINKLGYHLGKVETIRELEQEKVYPLFKLYSVQTLWTVLKDDAAFDHAYELLSDNHSKETFNWFIKARVVFAFLGNAAFKLYPPSVDEQSYSAGVNKITSSTKKGLVLIEGFKLKPASEAIFASFRVEQYRLPEIVEPEQGDWVLDLGGFFGETAFWFSKRVGEMGKVFCFEPVSENYRVLEENLRTNKVKNIVPMKMAVGDFTGEIRISGSDSGATFSEAGATVPCISIDEYVSRFQLKKVNMIKMDIEGYELNALKGAKETLKRFRPKLAISVYHKGDDLPKIPFFIEQLSLSYRMFLRHYSPQVNETVLFAIV